MFGLPTEINQEIKSSVTTFFINNWKEIEKEFKDFLDKKNDFSGIDIQQVNALLEGIQKARQEQLAICDLERRFTKHPKQTISSLIMAILGLAIFSTLIYLWNRDPDTKNGLALAGLLFVGGVLLCFAGIGLDIRESNYEKYDLKDLKKEHKEIYQLLQSFFPESFETIGDLKKCLKYISDENKLKKEVSNFIEQYKEKTSIGLYEFKYYKEKQESLKTEKSELMNKFGKWKSKPPIEEGELSELLIEPPANN